MSRCGWPNKTAHVYQSEAQKHLDSLRRLGDGKNQHIYWCHGGHWHIGDKTKGSKKSKRKANQ